MMAISFITNIISIHQMDLWDNFVLQKDIVFNYIYTTEESKGDRYSDYRRNYCVFSKDIKNIETFLTTQDIIIVSLGSIEDSRINDYLKNDSKKNLIIYSEHIFKNSRFSSAYNRLKVIAKRLLGHNYLYSNISKDNVVMCASFHAGGDFHALGFSKNNIYKFGYFPKYFYNYNIEEKHTVIFAGRNIYSKHPEDSVFAFNYLNNNNYKCVLKIVGQGFEDFQKNCSIIILGELNREKLVENLFSSDLFIFSSTYEEGWGVVLLEAMAAGCFVIANANAGSTNFIVKNGINGFTYKNRRQLKKRLKQYLKLPYEKKIQMRKNAVDTIKNEWSSGIAAIRLYELCFGKVFKKKEVLYDDGPLSKVYKI